MRRGCGRSVSTQFLCASSSVGLEGGSATLTIVRDTSTGTQSLEFESNLGHHKGKHCRKRASPLAEVKKIVYTGDSSTKCPFVVPQVRARKMISDRKRKAPLYVKGSGETARPRVETELEGLSLRSSLSILVRACVPFCHYIGGGSHVIFFEFKFRQTRWRLRYMFCVSKRRDII